MEVKDLSSIHFAEYNPRILTDQAGANLDASITTFGDISGITNNLQTNTLVTGHQRLAILKKRYGANRIKFYIEHRFDVPDEYGTVALGYVAVEGTNLHLAYREVMWGQGKEKAANIAANKIEAQFDTDLLAQLDYDLSQLENGDELLALTGQREDEVAKLLSSVGVEEPHTEPDEQNMGDPDDGMQRFNIKFTDEQYAMVYQAIGLMKRARTLTNEPNSDLDANALYYICKSYVENITSHNTEPTPPATTLATDDSTAALPTSDQLDRLPTV